MPSNVYSSFFSSWKPPVASVAALPTGGNTSGDARITKNTDDIYVWNGSAWVLVAGPSLPSVLYIGEPITSGTAHSVLFVDAAATLAQDSAYFYYDESTHQLALGTTTFIAAEKERIMGLPTFPAPDAPGSPSANFTYGAGGAYPANGYTHEYRIYSYVTIGGSTYYSPAYATAGPVTDDSRSVSPPNVTGVGGTINYGSGGYTANGNTHTLTVYSYLTRVGGTAYANVGGFNQVTDDNSANQYNIDWVWDDMSSGGAEGYIIVNENNFFIDVGAVTSFNDDNTQWITGGFVNTPNSVRDDYNIDVSWAPPGAVPTGYVVLVSDDFSPKVYDYYYTNTSVGITDNNTASTPSPNVSVTSYSGTSLNVTGDIIFSGKILGSDQFIPNNLIIGDDQNPVGTANTLIGRANTLTAGANTSCALFGIGNNLITLMDNCVFIGNATVLNNSVTTEYTAVLGNANTLTSDATYNNIVGWDNDSTDRLVSILGQQNSMTAPRTSAVGTLNTVDGEHSVAIGYSNTVTGTDSVGIGYSNVASGTSSAAIGHDNTASADSACAVGDTCTATAARSVAIGVSAFTGSSGVIALAAVTSTTQTTDVRIQAYSSTTVRDVGALTTVWATSTDASRKGRVLFNVYDTAAREAMRMEASGTVSMLGFFGVAAIARPTNAIAAAAFVANTSGIANDTATWGGYTVGQVVTALKNLGFLT